MKKILQSMIVIGLLMLPLQAQQVGNPAPDFTLETLEHDSVSLSDHQGKVVFLFFFGYS